MQNIKPVEKVRIQYENYPYPPVNPADEKVRLINPVIESLDILNHYCFAGKKDFSRNFRVLIAGGGTGDAAIFLAEQLRDSSAEIIYVDLSSASMAIARERAEIRNLNNITWINRSLLEIPEMGLGKFDYINCSGVLHHLKNPEEGLKVLSDSLNDDGAMGIMVYAKYGRMAVYQMQEVLRLINRDEDNLQSQIDNAKEILGHLPAIHWLNHSPDMIINEVKHGDAGIYDLLLHSQDRSYSIPELYDFIESGKLTIKHLLSSETGIGNNLYEPSLYIRDKNILKKIASYPLKDRQAIAELMHSKICQHTFYCMKNTRPTASPDDPDNIPSFAIQLDLDYFPKAVLEVVNASKDIVGIIDKQTNVKIAFPKTRNCYELIKNIDGSKTIEEIIASVILEKKTAGIPVSESDLKFELNMILEAFLTHNFILLRHKTVKPFKTMKMMQQNN